jgi:hypothetical protein
MKIIGEFGLLRAIIKVGIQILINQIQGKKKC